MANHRFFKPIKGRLSEHRGFTLVELMIVIAIVSILANFAVLQTGRFLSKTRDARRIADADAIQKALFQYYQDHGTYPACGGAVQPNGAWCTSNDASWATLGTFLAPYVSHMPYDPLRNNSGQWGGSDFGYSYFNDAGFYGPPNKEYMFVYHLENDKAGMNPGWRMSDGTYWNYGGVVDPVTIITFGAGDGGR